MQNNPAPHTRHWRRGTMEAARALRQYELAGALRSDQDAGEPTDRLWPNSIQGRDRQSPRNGVPLDLLPAEMASGTMARKGNHLSDAGRLLSRSKDPQLQRLKTISVKAGISAEATVITPAPSPTSTAAETKKQP